MTSKFITSKLHTQYVNMKSKCRCFHLPFTGQILSPSTGLTNTKQDLPLSIHTYLSRENETSSSCTAQSIIYTVWWTVFAQQNSQISDQEEKEYVKSRYTISCLRWDRYAACKFLHYCLRKLEVVTQESGTWWHHRKTVFWKEIGRWSLKVCVTADNIPGRYGSIKLEVK